MARTFADDVADGMRMMAVDRQGTWMIKELPGKITLEYYRYGRGAEVTNRAVVTLEAAEPLTYAQWRLIKQQFANMGIAPLSTLRASDDRT